MGNKKGRQGGKETRSGHSASLLVSSSPLLLVFSLLATVASADVIVLANRTHKPIQLEVKPVTGPRQRAALQAGDSVPFFVDGRAHVSFASRDGLKRYLLDANSAYYFGESADGRVDLQKIGLGEDNTTINGRTLPGRAATAPVTTIPVRILVDEEEPARQQHWERRLRDRVQAASDILEHHARVRLKVVGVGTWDSDDNITDFFASLSEFERDAKPFPAQLAIGFTSQYQVVKGRTHMAGTRGVLHSHILVREWSQHMTEPERLELLVHELGHFLGASHSPERTSAMRPVLGDRQAVRAGFQVRFDPVNTLIMSMVGEELSRRRIQKVAEMSDGTKVRLRQIYRSLSPTMPDDVSAQQFVQRMDVTRSTPLVQGTKQVIAQITSAARTNLSLPAPGEGVTGQTRREGDALTEYYVREAAGIARFLPESVATSSFLLGLGIALDDSNMLRSLPKIGGFVQLVEADHERSLRLASLGSPTMRGRRDLAQHFFVSAHLASIAGTQAAGAIGLAKEVSDANGGSGFSFADVAANRAGILFASGVADKRFTLISLSENFAVPTYMPSVDGLPEGITAADLQVQYGHETDARFQRQLQQIDALLMQLPPYRKPAIAIER